MDRYYLIGQPRHLPPSFLSLLLFIVIITELNHGSIASVLSFSWTDCLSHKFFSGYGPVDNRVITTPKRWILSFVFAVLFQKIFIFRKMPLKCSNNSSCFCLTKKREKMFAYCTKAYRQQVKIFCRPTKNRLGCGGL